MTGDQFEAGVHFILDLKYCQRARAPEGLGLRARDNKKIN